MKPVNRILLALVLVSTSTAASAEILDLSVRNNSFRGALNGPLSRFIADTNGLYEIGAIVKTQQNDDLLISHLGMLVSGDAGMRNFNLAAGLGVRGVYIGRDHDSGSAAALGGQLEARFPGFERVGYSLYGFYSPEVVTFGEFDQYYEVGSAIDYQLLKDGSVYVGYRNVNLSLVNSGHLTADNGFHVGIRLHF